MENLLFGFEKIKTGAREDQDKNNKIISLTNF